MHKAMRTERAMHVKVGQKREDERRADRYACILPRFLLNQVEAMFLKLPVGAQVLENIR